MKNIIIVVLLLVIGFLAFHNHAHRVKGVKEIEVLNSHWLRQIAANSLETDDLPIGAILYYEDEVIGEGNHTVIKNDDPTAHAVIQALRDAANNMGYEAFHKLDRKKLKLITTYDPCTMCKGAAINNRIENVKFMMPAKMGLSWDNTMRGITYELNKTRGGREYIQDSLFVIHPDYPFVPNF